jgi:putative ubiquitin-RnfH superfamily antitoxin RatB of RatAB toxin-antitoxin module
MVNVEIIYIANDQAITHLYCHLPDGATVNDALVQSELFTCCPDAQGLPIGIFSKCVEKTTVLKPGDRIEIYRSLLIDPKEKRRQRANKRQIK